MMIVGINGIAVCRHELPVGVGVEGAGAGIKRFAVGSRDLKPSSAVDRKIVGVAGLRQRTLHVQLSHRSRSDAQAQIGAFRYRGFAGAVRNTLHAIDLIEQIGEFGARTLVRCRVDICDVVRDDFDIGLLRVHAGRRYS